MYNPEVFTYRSDNCPLPFRYVWGKGVTVKLVNFKDSKMTGLFKTEINFSPDYNSLEKDKLKK